MAPHVAGHEFLSFKIEGWGGDPLLPWGVTMSVYRKKNIDKIHCVHVYDLSFKKRGRFS